jgi:hypothetical protein
MAYNPTLIYVCCLYFEIGPPPRGGNTSTASCRHPRVQCYPNEESKTQFEAKDLCISLRLTSVITTVSCSLTVPPNAAFFFLQGSRDSVSWETFIASNLIRTNSGYTNSPVPGNGRLFFWSFPYHVFSTLLPAFQRDSGWLNAPRLISLMHALETPTAPTTLSARAKLWG